MLVEGLHAYLAANTSLQALLGTISTRTDSVDGLFPMLAAATPTMPYIVYQQIAGEPTTISYQGTNALQTTRWRFSCYGSTYKSAKELAKVLKQVLFSMLGDLPAGAATVQGSWLRLEADDSEPIPRGTLYGVHVDFEIIYVDRDV